ncbi:MAG: YbaK/EbsC family protein [Methylophaga sp.]|nr:YbaK/EbsC family protein [Methylophaga sp.]
MSELQSPVTELLQQKQIAYSVIEIPLSDDKKPIRNLEEWLSSQGRDPHSVVRSLLFKTGSDKFVLLAVTGGGRADWGVLRKQLSEKKLRMAEFAEVSAATGYVVGAVPPIALPDAIEVLVDQSISHYDEVIIGSGVLGYALALRAADLQNLLQNAPIGEFIKD